MLNGIFTITIDTNSSIKFVESSDLIIDRISSIMNKNETLIFLRIIKLQIQIRSQLLIK